MAKKFPERCLSIETPTLCIVSGRIALATTSILLPSTRRILSRSFFSAKKRLIALTCNRVYVLRAREFPNKNPFRYHSSLCKKGDAQVSALCRLSFYFYAGAISPTALFHPFRELIRLTSV